MIHLENGDRLSPRLRVGTRSETSKEGEDQKALMSDVDLSSSHTEEIVVRPPSIEPASKTAGDGSEGRSFKSPSAEGRRWSDGGQAVAAQIEAEEKPDIHLEKFQHVNMVPEAAEGDENFDDLDLEEAVALEMPLEEDVSLGFAADRLVFFFSQRLG